MVRNYLRLILETARRATILTAVCSPTLSINYSRMILIIYRMSREPLSDQSLITLKVIHIPLSLIFQSSPKQFHLQYNNLFLS